jgi:outer membrane protein OmpA-like peptidoglycan-associated protein/YHS domain-containing protein
MNSLPFYDALYFTTMENGEWTTPTNITPQVQSDGNQYATALSYDGKTLYLSWEDPFNSDIYVSEYEDGRWTRSRSLSNEINTKFWESHASVSKDGKTLYFASNRQETTGEMDIFISRKIGNKWSEPENIGEVINTDLNEDTPFISEDGKRLYFSSQGHESIGGYDIFYSDMKEDGTWSTPVNIGYPINTTDDDLFYVPVNPYEGYMARYIEDGNGGQDILRFEFPGLAEYKALQTGQEVEEDIQTRVEPEDDVLEQLEEETESIVEETEEPEITEDPEIEEQVIERTVAEDVEETVEKTQVEVRPIFFDFDDASLKPEAKEELNKIADLLKQNKAVEVQLIGYADPLGNQQYNKNLSKKRAQAALEYLKNQGINTQRLATDGKGETNFIAINKNPDGSDNPTGRKYNRRVEIHLDNADEGNIIVVKPEIVPENLKNK